jgi:hypothetical protein
MVNFQIWLVSTLARATPIREFMHTKWGWPAAESLHFIGLSLLVGTISVFDLRLLGLAKRVPIAALHRLVPWGLVGYGITAGTGALFLMAEPDQYVYNPAFHLKVLFMLVAGLNASAFYLTSYRRTTAPGASADAPPAARIIAAASLFLWISVIIAGRLLTFYRPWPCGPAGPGFLAQCLPGYVR